MNFDPKSKAAAIGATECSPQRLSEPDNWYAPEIQLCFGPTYLVMIAKAWGSIWPCGYDVRVETLYWFIKQNNRSLRQQAQLASLMRSALDANEKWTYRQIELCQSSGYVKLHSPDNLPASANLMNFEPDNRAKYPIPTSIFHEKMAAWAELRTRVSINVFAKARHYSGNNLPTDAALPDGIEWDVVAWIRNQLTNGDRQ
jgi:hypothetical protein